VTYPFVPAMLLLMMLVLALPVSPASGAGVSISQDTTALQFHGFRAGARLDELERRVRRLDGRLRCDRATRDRRVSECRAAVTDSAIGGPAKIWVSAIDSVAGVITISADVEAETLDRWQRRIESRYGQVGTRVQGRQRMMQWVRRGRMLRLTWRTERGGRIASVSLVDGRVLDAWGKRRTASP
jgi:hypothetical protein